MASIWGGLAALGDVAVDIGTNMSKRAFADRLEQQREARAEAREDKKVTDTKLIDDGNGGYAEAMYNAKGFEIGTRRADASKIQSLQSSIEKEKRDKESHGWEADLQPGKMQYQDENIRRLANENEAFPDDKALRQELLRAQIDAQRASAEDSRAAAATRGLNSRLAGASSSEASPEDYAAELMKTNKAWFDSAEFESEDDKLQFARDVAVEAARTGINPTTLMRMMKEQGSSVFYKPNKPTGAMEIVLPSR